LDRDSFDTRLGVKLKAERDFMKPAGRHRLIFAVSAASIAAAAAIIALRTWIGQ